MSDQRSRQGTRTAGLKARTQLSQMSAKRAARLKAEGRYQAGSTFAKAAPRQRTPSELQIAPGFGFGLQRAPARAAKTRRDTIPRKVRALVNKRDPWCVMCGKPAELEQHHRRPKQMGGDPRPHTDCPCNLVRACRKHHRWIHRNRREAEALGLLLPAETVLPGSESVARASDDGGVTSWPSCDGQWLPEPGEVAA